MNNKSWEKLRKQVIAAIEESRVIVGHEAFYRTQTMREVLGWMDDIQSPPAQVDTANRLVCGIGIDNQARPYEVVRRVRAKEYRVEWEDGTWRKISLADAVNYVQTPYLGVEGLGAFDRAWTAKQEAA